MEVKRVIIKSKTNSIGKAPLRFQFTYYGEQVIISVGESVSFKNWDKKRKTVTKEESGYLLINSRLNEKEKVIKDIYTQAELKGIQLSVEAYKTLYEKAISKKQKGYTIGSVQDKKVETFDEVAAYHETVKNKEPETKRKFRQIYNHLKRYKPDIDFDDFTSEFLDEYLYGYLREDLGMEESNIDKHIAQIKMIHNFTRKAFPYIQTHSDYNFIKRYHSTHSNRFYLKPEEVKALEKYQPQNEKEEVALDLFLIGCYTSLRWQNLIKIKRINLVWKGGQSYLSVFSNKGKKEVSVPVNKKGINILEKWNFNIPTYPNHELNAELKKIGRSCGLKDEIIIKKVVRNEMEISSVPKWSKLSFHISRHTYAVNFLKGNNEKGMSALVSLKNIMGHSLITTTQIYLQLLEVEGAEMYSNMAY